MKVKATRNQLMAVLGGLQSNLKAYKGVKLSYAVLKNKGLLEKEQKLIQTLRNQPPSEGYRAYEDERVALCEMMAVKDDDGKPVITNGRYVMCDQAAFDTALEALREKHAAAVAEEEDRIQQGRDFVEEEVEMELHAVAFNLLDDSITAEALAPLMLFIEEVE